MNWIASDFSCTGMILLPFAPFPGAISSTIPNSIKLFTVFDIDACVRFIFLASSALEQVPSFISCLKGQDLKMTWY